MDALSPRAIVGEGTPECDWQAWLQCQDLPAAHLTDWIRPGGTLHVVAPHPDDEILGCGGLMRQATRRGMPVQLWAVTDGEASHPGSPRWPTRLLACQRTYESELALHRLSVRARRHRLSIPDGGVEEQESYLAARLTDGIQPNDIVVAPWQWDGHPDHEAVARASRQAAGAHGCTFLEVPIWGWHWAHPARADIPAERAMCLHLAPEDQQAKAHAIQAFRTQLQPDASTGQPPILPAFALARLQRPVEILLR